VPAPKKKRSGPRGSRPRRAQIAVAAAVATELAESGTYVEDFGARAPAAAQIAFVVANAAKWRDTWHAAKAFFEYASEQRARWEDDASAHMNALKPMFDYATSRDVRVADRYAATTKYLGATKAIAERGAASRKAKGQPRGGTL
jgi:hypothetical protein